MRFAVGIWDRLFGERITLQLHDGTVRRVSRKWWEEMQRQEKVREVGGEGVTVHILSAGPDLSGIDSPHVLDEILLSQAPGPLVRTEIWLVGRDVPRETVDQNKDPETGHLYVLMARREGYDELQPFMVTRSLWEKARLAEGRVSGFGEH